MLKKTPFKFLRVCILLLLQTAVFTTQGCDNASDREATSSALKQREEKLSVERNVTFYHPYRDGVSGKEAVVAFEPDSAVEVKIMKVLSLLFSDSTKSEGYLTEGIKVLDVFIDSEAMAYVNLDETSSASERIGVSAEREFISSLVLTVLNNFPEVSGVRILVNDEERDTLSGHIDISKPFYLLSEEGVRGEADS